jgi:hypothetical protein
MAVSKKRPQCTREFLKPPEKVYRNRLFAQLLEQVDRYPICNKSKVFTVRMVLHKLEEQMEVKK